MEGHIGESQRNNEAVVTVINSGYSRYSFLMHVLRCIFFFSATFDFNLTAAHIPGCYNTLADAISRNKHVLRGIKKEHSKQANITKSRLPITPNILLKLRSVWEEEDLTSCYGQLAAPASSDF